MFTDKIEPIISNGVATIGGKDIIPKRIGKIRQSWDDKNGKLHIKTLCVCILLATGS